MAFSWTSNITVDTTVTSEMIEEIQSNLDYIDDHLANIAYDGSVRSGQYSSRDSSDYGYCSGQNSSALSSDNGTVNPTANSTVRASN